MTNVVASLRFNADRKILDFLHVVFLNSISRTMWYLSTYVEM